jgi:hypothetical protein
MTMFTRHSNAKLLLLLAILFTLIACGSPSEENSSSPLETISVTIHVTSTTGAPLEGVRINTRNDNDQTLITNAVTSTSEGGEASVPNVPETTNVVFIFEKDGYAAQVKVFSTPPSNVPVTLDVVMIMKGAPQLFSSDEAAELNGQDGVYLSVGANAFVDASGNTVSGEVALQMTPVDVSTEAGLLAFPGAFSGIPEDGSGQTNIVSLGTTEFTFSQNGEELQLAEGETAVIDMPIYIATYPDGSAVEIGDEIPLWSLNETSGIWLQEDIGEVISKPASPTGLAMRAEVSHFTWWNTDWYPITEERFDINLSVVGVDENGSPTSVFDGERVSIVVSSPGSRVVGSGIIGQTEISEVFEGLWCFHVAGSIYSEGSDPFYVESNQVCQVLEANVTITLEVNTSGVEFEVTNFLRPTATAQTEYGACGDLPRVRAKSSYPITYTISGGSLPPGLALETNGAVTGTPTTSGQYQVQIDVAEDVNGERGESDIVIWDINVSPELEIDAPLSRSIFQVGYEAILFDPFSADGGLEEYAFRLSPNGTLPPGMSLNPDTSVTEGTPGRVNINGSTVLVYESNTEVEVHDQNCASASDSYTQYTIWAPLLSGQPAAAIVGENFSFTLTNTEGPIESWDIIRGLPAWASLNTITGEITGVPSRSDVGIESEVTIHASGPIIESLQDAFGNGSHTFTLEVEINIPEVADVDNNFTVAVGQSFNLTPTNTGGTADTWETDNLPVWLTLNTTSGAILGSPTTIALHENIVLRAINPGGTSETSAFAINVVSQIQVPQLSGTPTVGQVDTSFVFTPNNGGGAVNQWALTGSLPNGLTFSNGTISGTPSIAGTFSGVEITGTNAGGNSVLAMTVEVSKGNQTALSFRDGSSVEKNANDAAFVNTVLGGSGIGAVSYQSSDASVAAINSSSGIITPAAAGQTIITVTKAEDANYLSTSANFTLNVNLNGVILGTPDTGFLRTAYSFVPTVASGITITNWQIVSGNLPSGLNLNVSTGAIVGIPSELQTANFDLRGDTAAGDAYGRSMQITIVEPPGAPLLFSNANFDLCDSFGEVGCYILLAENQSVDITLDPGTSTPVTWSISGDIPPGLSFNDSLGSISGTPTSNGQYDVTVSAENDIGSDSIGFTFDILTEQDPIAFDNIGPIDAILTDNTLTNVATGGSSVSSIVYRSSNTSIATVNSGTGEVTFESPGSVEISATRSSDGTYLPISTEYSLAISLPTPIVDYVYSIEVSTMAGPASYIRAKTTIIDEEYPTVVYASTEDIIDPTDPEILSATANVSGNASIFTTNLATTYTIASQIFSGAGDQSEISETKLANTLISDQIIDGDAGTGFGNRMAIDGDVLVVRNTLNDAYASTGDVSVYERIENIWTLTQKLEGRQDWWGKALDVHKANNGVLRIAVGSDVSSNFGNPQRQGGLATYTKVLADICGNEIDDDSNGQTDEASCETVPAETLYNNGVWVIEQYVEGIYPETVELNDNWMAIGNPDSNNCDTNIFTCGEVLIYRFPWTASADQTLTAPQQRTMNFHFGSSLASDADVLIVGAPGAFGSICFFNCGVYAYRDNGTGFEFEGSIGGNVRTEGRAFGHSVSISGNTLVIGDPTTPNEGGPTNDDGGDGVAYIYQKADGETWDLATKTMQLISPTEAASTPALNFGVSISLNDRALVVGDQKQNCINADSQCGMVHVFNQNEIGVFSQSNVYSFGGFTPLENNGFGFVVDTDGSTLAVSQTVGESQQSPGKVMVYTLP